MGNSKKVHYFQIFLARLPEQKRQQLVFGLMTVLGGVALPAFALKIVTAILSSSEAEKLTELLPSKTATLADFLPILTGFINLYCVGLVIAAFIMGSALFVLLQIAHDYCREVPSAGLGRLFFQGIRRFAGRFLSFAVITTLLFLSAQILSLPAVIIATLSLMVPAGIVFTNGKTFPTFWSCITLKYIPTDRWRGFTRVITLGTGVYLLYFCVGWGTEAFAQMAGFWRLFSPDYLSEPRISIPISYILRALWESITLTLAITGFGILSIKLYMQLSHLQPPYDVNN